MGLENKFLLENVNLLSFIVDNIEGPCYISDFDTNELIFMNKKVLELLNCKFSDIEGRMCYEVLQNQTAPCSFCSNPYLKENEYYRWEHYNEYLGKYYEVNDTLIVHEGRRLRLEIATDVTALKEKYINLEDQTTIEQLLVECASTLSKGDDIDFAINKILSLVGEFYQAERSYIFEIDELEQYSNNTHEWCAEGVEPQIDFLQKVPLSAITGIMEKITTVGAYCIDSLSEDLDTNSPEYQILEMQGIKSLLIVPLEDKGKIVGFLGVDDPVVHKSNLKVLQTVGIFVYDDLDKVKTSQKLEFLINCDKLTGLYNRNYYDTALAKIKESQLKSVGIVYIDINGLKIINTNYGHSFGDTYIVNCTQTLREHFEYDIFRISGDEFVIFLEDIDYKEFNKKVTMFEDVLKKNKQVSMSLGSSWCNNLEDIDKHIMAADTAMLKNKENHYRKIEDCMEFFQQTAEELLLEEINNSGFEVFLQPKIFLDTNKIIGAEALIRKKDELGNYIPPNLFIPRYEKQGTIFLIDLFVLRQVCELLSEAKNIGMSELPHISINFSRITLLTPEIHTKSLEICKQYNIESSMVTIEVTEDCGFVESTAIGHAIEKLKEIGFKISLDDFGCKYSNIEILSSVSFDEVKLDKSLLYSNNTSVSKKIILEHLIEMFQAFTNVSIVVEGIEEDEQLDILKSKKGLIGQGYIFSKPLPKKLFWEYYNKK